MGLDRWDYIEIELYQDEYGDMMDYLETEVDCNTGYGKADLLKFFGIPLISDPTRNICSELVHNALVKTCHFKKNKVISPLMLAILLKKQGFEIKNLQ